MCTIDFRALIRGESQVLRAQSLLALWDCESFDFSARHASLRHDARTQTRRASCCQHPPEHGIQVQLLQRPRGGGGRADGGAILPHVQLAAKAKPAGHGDGHPVVGRMVKGTKKMKINFQGNYGAS